MEFKHPNMIKITRNTTTPTELTSQACKNDLQRIIQSPQTAKASSDIYRGKKTNTDGSFEYTVVEALKKIYNCKCAYCEKTTHEPKIDHHRPKGRVVGENMHNHGYYWLCYEWTNLLPSCTNCNEIGSKGSKYPINSARNNTHPIHGTPPTLCEADFAYNSTFNTNELPLLLHPEYSSPEDHFNFLLDGTIVSATTEGLATIKALKLDNDDLNGWRKKIYEYHFNKLSEAILEYYKEDEPITYYQFKNKIHKWTKELINNAYNNKLDYSLFRTKLLEHIEYLALLQQHR